ncbi:MAG: ubiquitin-like small modifier protein 1 [Nitrospinota bacterium]
MRITVRVPTPLRSLTGNQESVQVEAANIREAFLAVEQKFPGIRERLYDKEGKLRRFVNVYVNEEDIRFLDGEDTALKEGDEVSIVPAIAGGC